VLSVGYGGFQPLTDADRCDIERGDSQFIERRPVGYVRHGCFGDVGQNLLDPVLVTVHGQHLVPQPM